MNETSIEIQRVERTPRLIVTFVPPARGKTSMTIRIGDIEIGRVRNYATADPTVEFHSGTNVIVAAETCEAIIAKRHLFPGNKS